MRRKTIVKGKRMINVASIWIIVIFTVIAVTLLGIFILVYSSAQNREAYSTLREEASILSDNADYQIMTPIRTEPIRRLTAKEGLMETVQSVSLKGEADSMEVKKCPSGAPQHARPFRSVTGCCCISPKLKWLSVPTVSILSGIKNIR